MTPGNIEALFPAKIDGCAPSARPALKEVNVTDWLAHGLRRSFCGHHSAEEDPK